MKNIIHKGLFLCSVILIVTILSGCTNVGGTIFLGSSDEPLETMQEVEIVRVIDGDTVVVDNGSFEETVRLLLIDTPESVHPDKPAQPFGEEAKQFAEHYLPEGLTVTLERGVKQKDKYDRTLGHIWVADVNFNQLMTELGYARVAYVEEPNDQYVENFRRTEQVARDKGLNIWSIENYVTEYGFDDN